MLFPLPQTDRVERLTSELRQQRGGKAAKAPAARKAAARPAKPAAKKAPRKTAKKAAKTAA